MRDSQHGGPIMRSGGELSALARTVVAHLAAKVVRAGRQVDPVPMRALQRAIIATDPAEFEGVRRGLRRAGVGDAELVDIYFPAIARGLGSDWLEDRLSWVEVTVGMARLQALLHQISRTAELTFATDAPSILVVLPEGEQHSFGVQVLAAQLRRQGVLVELQIGARPEILRALARRQPFDCVLISASCRARLEICRKVVDALREGSSGRLWVAIGGAVLDEVADAHQQTGADVATSDPFEALAGAGRMGAVRREAVAAEATGGRLSAE